MVERVCYSRGVQSRRGPAVLAEGQKSLRILLVLADGAMEFFVKLHIYHKSVREGIGADPAGLGDSQSGTGSPAGALPEAPHLIPSVRPLRQQRQAQRRARCAAYVIGTQASLSKAMASYPLKQMVSWTG